MYLPAPAHLRVGRKELQTIPGVTDARSCPVPIFSVQASSAQPRLVPQSSSDMPGSGCCAWSCWALGAAPVLLEGLLIPLLSAEQSWGLMLEAQTGEYINLFTHDYSKVQFYNPWDCGLRGVHSPCFHLLQFSHFQCSNGSHLQRAFPFPLPFYQTASPSPICFSQGSGKVEGKGARGWELLSSWEQQHFVPAVHFAAAEHLP